MNTFFYVLIEKETNRCFQTIDTNTPNFNLNNEYAYSMEVTVRGDYLGKYYIDGVWVEREQDEQDENAVDTSDDISDSEALAIITGEVEV